MKKFQNRTSFKNVCASCMAIVIGIAVGMIIIVLSDASVAKEGMLALLVGPLQEGMTGIGRVIYYAIPLIMTGLSVGFAFRTGLFNIGAPGQFLLGAFVAVYIGVKWVFLPDGIHWLVALGGAFLSGAFWAWIPGYLKAHLHVNEVISCIMMNYIGLYFVNYSVMQTIYDELRNQSLAVQSSAIIPKMGMDRLFEGTPANGGILIAILFVLLVYFILHKTTLGFEMKACGLNKEASRYAGIQEKKIIVRSMMLSGALAGIGGGLLYLSGSGKFIEVVDVLPVEGYNGIPIALLGLSNPIGILCTGILLAYLNVGGTIMQQYGFIPQIVDMMIACILYCSALSYMIRLYLHRRKIHQMAIHKDKKGGL